MSASDISTTKEPPKAILCFHRDEQDPSKFVCKICELTVSQNPKKGVTNLTSHLNRKHANWEDRIRETGQSTLTGGAFLDTIDEDSRNIYGWLDLIVNGDMTFTIVENSLFKKYIDLKSVSRTTIRPIFEQLIKRVQEKVATKLPEHFGIIFDGKIIFMFFLFIVLLVPSKRLEL